MKITNDKMNMYLLIGLVVIGCYVGTWAVLANVGREYQGSRQTLQEGLESSYTTIAVDKLPAKSELYVVYFTADWCGPCRLMKPHWKHKTVQDQLKKYRGTKSGTTYKPYKIDVDVEKHIPIVKKYKVTGIPCIILVTNDGVEYARSVGGLSQSELKAFLVKGAVWKKER